MTWQDKPYDLGPLPAIHPRYTILNQATLHLNQVLDDISKQFELTSAEYASMLSQVLDNFNKRLIAIERRQSNDAD